MLIAKLLFQDLNNPFRFFHEVFSLYNYGKDFCLVLFKEIKEKVQRKTEICFQIGQNQESGVLPSIGNRHDVALSAFDQTAVMGSANSSQL